jgi:molybdenum cofactor cytidylyltransferase
MKVPSHQIGAMVLAAGFSRRFGTSKQLARLPNGKTVLEQTLLNLSSVTSNILLVTRAEISPTTEHLGIKSCVCDNADQGMGASLAYGMTQIPDWEAVMICLGDMPFMSGDSYQKLLAAADADRIIVPTLGSQTANPCVFGQRFYSELKLLQGDSGGRSIIKRHPDSVIALPMTDQGLLQDIDTPADLAARHS